MADAKQQIMDQIRQQQALGNARALVEVRIIAVYRRLRRQLILITETQRALFRALRPQPRLFPFLRRTNVLHRVHGEVHGGMEHR